MKERKLNYRIHDPNSPEVTAAYLEKLFIEVNRPKVERLMREAAQLEGEDDDILSEINCIQRRSKKRKKTQLSR